MKIYKYPLDIVGTQTIPLAKWALILDVQMQGDQVVLWALVDPEAPIVFRHLAIYGTGLHILENPGVYIATVQKEDLVFHVFETIGEQQ